MVVLPCSTLLAVHRHSRVASTDVICTLQESAQHALCSALENLPLVLQILGRTSVDIIKSGGFKISALDIESTLLHHPGVAEAAVLGVPDDMLGQVVAALIHPKAPAASTSGNGSNAGSSSSSSGADGPAQQVAGDDLVSQLKALCKEEVAAYAIPRQWKLLDGPLPRNAMGKVNKKELLKQFFPQEAASAATPAGQGESSTASTA